MPQPPAGEEQQAQRRPHEVRLPGFVPEEPIGLGDLVKRATSAAGVRPCGPCQERARRLNSWLVFTGKRG
jgi:hypothetical protein